MSNKVFIGLIAILVIGFVGFAAFRDKPETERPGVAHEDKGRQHVAEGTIKNEGAEPRTSGDHYGSPLPGRVYDQEIQDGNAIHNMEHGYIYISYRPDLPAEQVNKIKTLFFEPFSREKFEPNKVIMAPRSLNDSPIIMSSWIRSMKFHAFDEEKMVEYYLRNVSKSPEPAAS